MAHDYIYVDVFFSFDGAAVIIVVIWHKHTIYLGYVILVEIFIQFLMGIFQILGAAYVCSCLL